MEAKKDHQNSIQTVPPTRWVLLLLTYLSIPLILLVAGGDMWWWQAWVYSVMIVVVGLGARIWAERRHPGLMMERLQFENAPGIKPWDRVLSPLVSISVSFPLVIVAGLDHRYEWSPGFPLWLNLTGFILIGIGYTFASWAMAENRFFSSVVRIQSERGHVVCDSGPYRIVRHPGYAGNILPLPGIALALSSLWALIPALVAFILILIRTSLEDQALQEELPGYKDYARHVRYRLLPGIW